MQWLAQLCVRRPVFSGVLTLVIIVLGLVGYSRLGVDQFPNVDVPVVLVTTRLDGAAPTEVETEITDKIESAINTIDGIDELRSTSSDGFSQVVVTFVLEKPVDIATQDVRDKVNNVLRDLPEGIDPPVITKVDTQAAPILFLALRSKQPIREVTEVADKQVRRQIESISGVGQVNIVGGRAREIRVWLDPMKLRAHGLAAVDVQRALAAGNLTIPGGSIETGPESITLRVAGRAESVDELARLVVRASAGHPIRIQDVARVEDGEEDLQSMAAYDGERTVVLSVRKQSGTNTVAVVDSVKARLSEIATAIPQGMQLEIVRDNSASIRTGVNAVREHLLLGAVFAALVVLLFLGNLRSTLIAAVAIPISIIGTFALMWLQGFSLNMLTLLALALSVGIVIDDAIIVLENITRYVEKLRQKPFPAAVLATREIGLAVLATTLSLMAVFVPVAFVGGVPGRFLKNFGYTMASAIGISLLVSFSLTPMLSARLLSFDKPGKLARLVEVFYGPIERVYLRLLGFSLRQRWLVVLAIFATLGATVPLAKSLPSSFVPPDDNAQFEVSLRAPEGTSVQQTALIAERVAQRVRALPGVDHTVTTVAGGDDRTPNRASIYVAMSDPREREVTQQQVMAQTRQQILAKLPAELRVTVAEVAAISSGSSSAAVQYVLAGPDLGRLEAFAAQMGPKIRQSEAVLDFDTNLIVGKPEFRVDIDRERAADLGVQVADIANTLRVLVAGIKATSFSERGEEFEVRLRADADFRDRVSQLHLVTVPSAERGTVPLSAVVRVSDASGAAEINRLGRQRQVTFMANVAEGYGESDVVRVIRSAFQELDAPAEYRLTPTGRSRSSAELAQGFLLAFSLSLVFMYLILAAQLESWLTPVIILLALPLTVPFALLSLLIFGQSLNLFSALGLLVLFGVVKKNSILQIDHTNHLRRQGLPRTRAILEANRDRLRPILMTTLAFVAGMLPLAVSKGVGAGFNRNTAGIVIGGQTFSLLLTLIAIPVAYALFDDAKEWVGSWRRRAREDRGQEELEQLLGVQQHRTPAE